MASGKQSKLRARLKVLCLIGGLVSFGISSGQPRDLDAYTAEQARFSHEQVVDFVAQGLLANYDVVAVGRFSQFPDSSNPLQPEQVIVTFEPVQVFKGQIAESVAVQVEMISDMLVFHGREQSRYVVRRQMFEESVAEREGLVQQAAALEQDYQAGEIALENYQHSRASLQEREERWLAESVVLLTARRVGPHGQSFYDAGGVISQDEEYLVALNTSAHDFNTFIVRDIGQRSVFWGERAEDLVAALTRIVR